MRSGRRSRTASTTTSSCPTACTSRITTSSASRRGCARSSRPTSPSCARRWAATKALPCSPTSPTSATSSRRSTRRRWGRARSSPCTATRDPTAPSSSTSAAVPTSRRRSGSARSSSPRSPAPYWRGDEHGPMLQRIYGTAWESKPALEEHLHRLEEAERRDHRRLGAELDLFSFPEEIGSGLAVFHPKGALVRKLMEDYSRQRHEESGYLFVNSPHITKANLFETSRHLELVRGRHVPADDARRRRRGGHEVLPQADELPVPHPDLPQPAALLPRAAAALLRVRDGVPLRALRRRARPHARARHDPGRRPHLLHEGADGGRAAVAAHVRARPAARLRPRGLLSRALHATGRQGGRHGGRMGGGDRGAARGRPRHGSRAGPRPGGRCLLRPEDLRAGA